MTTALTSDLTREGGARMTAKISLTATERALMRLLVAGRPLAEAAPALGLSLGDAERLLGRLQSRCGASGVTRLLVLAVLNAWV